MRLHASGPRVTTVYTDMLKKKSFPFPKLFAAAATDRRKRQQNNYEYFCSVI